MIQYKHTVAISLTGLPAIKVYAASMLLSNAISWETTFTSIFGLPDVGALMISQPVEVIVFSCRGQWRS